MEVTENNQHNTEAEEKRPPGMFLTRPFAFIGEKVIGWINVLGTATIFLCLALWKTFRPKQFSKVIAQIYYIGARSTTIIILVSLFTGMVLGLQSYHALIKFGAVGGLGALVSLSLIRELGPVLTAIMITARAGSAITAEIGIQRIRSRSTPCIPCVLIPFDISSVLELSRRSSVFHCSRPYLTLSVLSAATSPVWRFWA